MFGYAPKPTKVTNTNITAFLLHRKLACFGAAVSWEAAPAVLSVSSHSLVQVQVKRRLYKCGAFPGWGYRAAGAVQRVASLSMCVTEVREIRWIQKILKSRLFPPHVSGEDCRREKCDLWERLKWVPLLSFSWIFPSYCLPLPKQARAAMTAFPFPRQTSAANQASTEACIGGKWSSMIA